MANPGWKSLLNFDQLLEAWQSPDTGAPQRVSLLRHIADLAAAVDPADRKGDGNTLPPLGKSGRDQSSALPISVEGQDGRISPPPDFGAGDVTPAGIVEALDSDGRYKDWDAATLRGWAELARQDPDKAKRMLAEVSARRDAGAKPAATPTAAEAAQARTAPTATATILPEGKLTVEVNATTPKKGSVLPAGSVRVPDKEMTPDEMLATLHGMAANFYDRTDRERETATTLAYRLERLQENNPKAFGKLPDELQRFSQFYKERMDEHRAAIVPKKLKDTTTEVPPDAWKKMTKDSADYAMWRTVRAFALMPLVGRTQDIPKEYRDDPVLKTIDVIDRMKTAYGKLRGIWR